MDGERFDYLTRRLAESLPRRRLLRQAAGVLAGAALTGRASRVRAQGSTCPPGSRECHHVGNDSPCCPTSYDCVEDTDGKIYCINPCPPDFTRCGLANCCGPDATCDDSVPGTFRCIFCPAGTTKCGAKNCCSEGQSCSDGQCVDACPVGAAAQRDARHWSRQREVTADAACEACPVGTVKCQGGCVPACRGRRSLDGTTCRCTKKKCPVGKTKCGGECVDVGTDPKNCGGCAGNGGVTCVDGKCCGGECQAPGITCCGFTVCGVDETCCGADATRCCPNERCCGDTCCSNGTYCANSRRGLCCPAGAAYCNVACCPIGTVCASFDKSICCPPTDPVYCERKHRCVKSRAEC
jgi:hypothetical protein